MISVANVPLFKDLPAEIIASVAALATLRVVRRGRHLYNPGDRADEFYFVVEGRMKVACDSDGREVIKFIARPDMLFGEMCIAGERFRKEFAVPMDKSADLGVIPMEPFMQLMLQYPALNQRVMMHVGERLRSVQDRLEALVFKDARARIIDYLRESALHEGTQVGFETLVRQCPSHRDIASLTDTSRQTVTMVFGELRKRNVIYIDRGNILIRDVNDLR